MKNKLGLMILATVFMASAVAAQPWISDISVNPSEVTIGEKVEVTAESQDSGRLMYIQANFGDGWTSKNCDSLYSCDNNEDPWTYRPDSSGDHEIEVRAVNQDLEYSDIETKTVQVSEKDSETHRLTVNVMDEDGNRLEYVKLDVNGETERTNSFGRARFDLEDGGYALEASKLGYSSESKDVEIDGSYKSIDITLNDEEEEDHMKNRQTRPAEPGSI
jgi:hypothetical protein